jgi:16S rRNA (cytosine1402-N4)-methyltransferase
MGERGTHVPVLLERCLELLSPALTRPGAVHVDATLGLGGHAEAVLAAHPDATLVGLDRDPQALELAGRRLARFAGRTHLVHAVYDELPEVLDRLAIAAVHGLLFDLGVSSLQLDEAARGFAYAQDAPLDMRMDQSQGRTAEEVINTYSAAELARILRVYGEERFASRIAAAIVRERAKAPLSSTARLAELVREAIPAPARRTGGHPAKRTFQALRIEVNGELAALERALPAAMDRLAPGGRVVVLSYHSLEDRLVKHALAARARSTAPVDLPVELPGTAPTLRLLTRGAEPPSEAEVAANPRAASVKLRAAERVDPAGTPAAAPAQGNASVSESTAPTWHADRESARRVTDRTVPLRFRTQDRPIANATQKLRKG